MTKPGMSAAIKTAVDGKFSIVDESQLQDFADALADALVTYITANAAVLVTGVSGGGGTAPGTIS